MGGIDEILKEIAGNGLINIYEKTALDDGVPARKRSRVTGIFRFNSALHGW